MATLEYPRHVHKPGGVFLVVRNEDEYAAALATGWTRSSVAPAAVAATHTTPLSTVAEASAVADESPAPTPRRKKAAVLA